MRYDVIIANPPYGKIGNEITKAVVDNIDYGTFVNLLPANDYRRNKKDALWQYVDINSMRPVQGGFKDATVTTMMCRVNKERALYISEAEFEIENYTDKSLKRYFYENQKRQHGAIDSGRRPQFGALNGENPNNTVLLGIRDMNHLHLPYSKNCNAYKWNVEKSIDIDTLKGEIGKTGSPNTQFSHYFIKFDSFVEKDNFVKFMYSNNGFRFFSKIFTALNTDSMTALSKWMPKVNWQKPQTVESILKDYGYTPSEIEEVVADLANFKSFGRGMEE